MQRITWYRLLAVGVLLTPIAGRAQAPPAAAPQATVRELATIEADTSGWGVVLLPSGQTLIYSVDDKTFAYDVATKRRTELGTNMLAWAVSPQGDRLAFARSSEDRTERFLWTMPIDPKTGIATGQAQRVGLRPVGRRGTFSPDGKMLSFIVGPRPDATWDVTLVPATGGPERVVANYPGRGSLAWSADGKWLYVESSWSDRTAIERVPVAGGRSEVLFPRTPGTEHQAVGLSPDLRVAFFHENPDRFFYRTASGVEGEISVALPPLDDGDGYNLQFTTLDSMRFTYTTQVRNQKARIFDTTTGQARDLLAGNVPSSGPAWSPDGRRLAVLSGNLSHHDITVVNTDGSSPRRYPVPLHLDGWGEPVWETPWSPDGRFLAFRAKAQRNGRQRVAPSQDDQGQLGLLDVTSGQTRVLTTSSSTIDGFVWRSDGKAIRVLKRTAAPTGSPSRSIVEIDLDGTERKLRDVPSQFSAFSSAFISDQLLLFGRGVPGERFLIPAAGGAERKLPGGTGSRFYLGASRDSRWLLWLVQNSDSQRTSVEMISSVGDSVRILPVPFSLERVRASFDPEGRHVILVGKVPGSSGSKLVLLPLDGSATRVIGEIPRGNVGHLTPSPDGKLLTYTADGIYTSTVHEIDFGPALEAIVKR